LTFSLRHQELLTILFVLLFDLHFTYEVVFVLDLGLDLCDVFGDLAICLLFQVVLVLVLRQFWCSKNVFDCVGDNKILVTHKTMDWSLIFLWYSRLSLMATLEFTDFYGYEGSYLLSFLSIRIGLPVDFFMKSLVDGFAAPFGWPKVAPLA